MQAKKLSPRCSLSLKGRSCAIPSVNHGRCIDECIERGNGAGKPGFAASWKLEGKEIVRHYEFADFAAAMVFVNQVAEKAEAAGTSPGHRYPVQQGAAGVGLARQGRAYQAGYVDGPDDRLDFVRGRSPTLPSGKNIPRRGRRNCRSLASLGMTKGRVVLPFAFDAAEDEKQVPPPLRSATVVDVTSV